MAPASLPPSCALSGWSGRPCGQSAHTHSHPHSLTLTYALTHHSLPATSFILMAGEISSWKFPNVSPQISPSTLPHPFRGPAFALGGAGLGQNCMWALCQPQPLPASGVHPPVTVPPHSPGDVPFGCVATSEGRNSPTATALEAAPSLCCSCGSVSFQPLSAGRAAGYVKSLSPLN